METKYQRLSRAEAFARRNFKDDISAAVSSEFAFDYIAAIVAYPIGIITAYRDRPWIAKVKAPLIGSNL